MTSASTVGASAEGVVRSCEPLECTEGNAGLSGLASANSYCCDTDLCNGAVKPNNQLPVVVALIIGMVVAVRLL